MNSPAIGTKDDKSITNPGKPSKSTENWTLPTVCREKSVGTRLTCFDVPKFDGAVVRGRDDELVVELETRHGRQVFVGP